TVSWHPYWPFTSLEASNAGLSFFEALNAGLGKEAGIAATINPLVYVQKYKSGTSLPTEVDTPVVTQPEANSDQLPPVIEEVTNVEEKPVEEPVVVEEVVVEEIAKIPSKLELNYEKAFAVNSPLLIKVIALDE